MPDKSNIEQELATLVWSDEPTNLKKIKSLAITRNQILTFPVHASTCPKHEQVYKNTCEFLTFQTKIPEEFRAYHAGPAGQQELVSSSRTFEDYSINNHVYFSLDLEETIRDYVLPESRIERGVYVADVRYLDNARILTHYHSGLLWNDDINTLISCYQDPGFMKELLTTLRADNTRFIESFKDKPREEIRNEIIRKIQGWLEHNTIPFDWRHLERYNKRNQTFVLVPSPIRVN